MKKFLFLLSLFIIFANSAFAQTNKKATTSKAPATKSAAPAKKSAPVNTGIAAKLSTKEPSFAGFTGSFIKFGPVSGSERPFTMTVEYAPWFFEIKGTANADYLTPDLGEDVIAVLAYYDAQGKAADGTNYQAGLFDIIMYLDDEPVKITNLSFALIGPAAAGSTVLAQAKTWNFEQGRVFRISKYESPILTAQATYLDKSHIEREIAAAKKRVADSIAREEKRVKDSIAKEEKRVKDSIARVQKKKRKAPAIEDDEEERPPRQKKKRRPVIEEEDEEEDEPPAMSKKKKRRK